MENNDNLPVGTDTSIDSFINEAAKPTAPAIDTTTALPAPGPAPAAGSQQAPPPYEPPGGEAAKPVFDKEDTAGSTPGADSPPPGEQKPNYSAEYKEKMVRYYMSMEEDGTAWLAAAICKTDDISLFKYSDQQREFLYTALEPYHDFIISALPPWLPLLLVYGGLKTDQFFAVKKMLDANKANAAGRQDPAAMNKVAQNLKNQYSERLSFALYTDGYYAKDRNGEYIPRDGNNTHRLEKPTWADLEKILSLASNRKAKLICKAFDITEADFAKHGINI